MLFPRYFYSPLYLLYFLIFQISTYCTLHGTRHVFIHFLKEYKGSLHGDRYSSQLRRVQCFLSLLSWGRLLILSSHVYPGKTTARYLSTASPWNTWRSLKWPAHIRRAAKRDVSAVPTYPKYICQKNWLFLENNDVFANMLSSFCKFQKYLFMKILENGKPSKIVSFTIKR